VKKHFGDGRSSAALKPAMSHRVWSLALLAGMLASCSSSGSGGSGGSGGGSGSTGTGGAGGAGGQSATAGAGGGASGQIVGTSGGTVTQNGVTLVIPAAALNVNTTITVVTSTAPSGYTLASSAFQFGPSGTTFSQPVAVTIPLTQSAPGAHVFWSNASGGFDDIGGTVSGMGVTANVTHFSIGFAALPLNDGGATDAGGSSGSGGTAGSTSGTDGAAGGAGGSSSVDASTDAGAADGGTPCASEADCPAGWACCLASGIGIGACKDVGSPKPPYACGSASETQLCQGTSDNYCYSSGTEGVYYFCKATGMNGMLNGVSVSLYECSGTQ
jgi:hypothetical protein